MTLSVFKQLPSLRALLALIICAASGPALNAAPASPSEITPPATNAPPHPSTGSVYFIGNATVLIRYDGFTILTDPNFIHKHQQVSLGLGLEMTRLTNPATEIDDLPPLDLIVLSHWHGDHFDRVAQKKLDKSVSIVSTPEAAEELKQRGFTHARGLETWSSICVKKGDASLRISSMPGRHGPPLSDLVLPELMGSMLKFKSSADANAYKIYISGDTLVMNEMQQIARRYPDIDLALLDLGGAQVLGIMVTMDAQQGMQMIRIVKPRLAIPLAYNDYDIMESRLADFRQQVKAAGLQDRVRYLNHGGTYRFKPSPAHANSRHSASDAR